MQYPLRELMSMQMVSLELASDGAQVRDGHSTVFYMLRCMDAPKEMMVQQRNVKPLAVVPGPKALSDNTVIWDIMLHWFAYMSPAGKLQMSQTAATGGHGLAH